VTYARGRNNRRNRAIWSGVNRGRLAASETTCARSRAASISARATGLSRSLPLSSSLSTGVIVGRLRAACQGGAACSGGRAADLA